ncbi:HXXEE domain-containing protein [Pseudalkalibacillus caeni]|uniref:HXXEE domain-containing protein n=1 Tax=Exobacillus caeni TaxID=2574798 RepID=UPI0014854558|nr:HXXEE domain-containing protein [Pseudalkalibacillus caeni]
MTGWLNSHIPLDTLIWLSPAIFMLHDFEEIIFVETWFKKKYYTVIPKIPGRFSKTFEEMAATTSAQFSIPVLLEFILFTLAAYLAIEINFFPLLVGFNLGLFLHVFTHLGQSFFLRTYALGSGTALVLVLPYTTYLFYRLLNENIVTGTSFLFGLPFMAFLLFVVLAGHKLAKRILPVQEIT